MTESHPTSTKKITRDSKNPMFDLSLPAANFWFDASNVILLIGALLIVAGTYGVFKTGAIKERYSDERISANEARTSEANARAAEANRIAEGERLARVKIEAGLASRQLTSEQASKLTAALASMKGSISSVSLTLLGDKEASDFASDLIQAIRGAGVLVSLTQIGVMGPPPYGLNVVDNAGGALRAAFDAAGITQVRYAPNTSPTPTILVGLKPPSF